MLFEWNASVVKITFKLKKSMEMNMRKILLQELSYSTEYSIFIPSTAEWRGWKSIETWPTISMQYTLYSKNFPNFKRDSYF